jgi:hypothetical protein
MARLHRPVQSGEDDRKEKLLHHEKACNSLCEPQPLPHATTTTSLKESNAEGKDPDGDASSDIEERRRAERLLNVRKTAPSEVEVKYEQERFLEDHKKVHLVWHLFISGISPQSLDIIKIQPGPTNVRPGLRAQFYEKLRIEGSRRLHRQHRSRTIPPMPPGLQTKQESRPTDGQPKGKGLPPDS